MLNTSDQKKIDTQNLLAARSRSVKLAPLPVANREMIAFTYGLPASESFPAREIAEATAFVMKEQYADALQYNTPDPLSDYLIDYIGRDQGIKLQRENLLVTAGSAQALSLVCRLLIDPGDVIIVEAPTFLGAVAIFHKAEAEIEDVPMDDDGMNIDALDEVLTRLKGQGKKVKFIYTIPTFQNPTGVTLCLQRRKQMLEVAARHEVLILEDDAYHGLLYSGEELPWIWTLDESDLVLHCGTFSKTLAAGMRLGWVGGSPKLIALLTSLKDDGGTSPFAGYVAAKFAENGKLEKHTASLIDLYRQKRDRMLDALAQYMPEGVRWTKPQGGFFVWLELPESIDTGKMLQRAIEARVNYLPGTACFAGGKGKNCIRLSFSFVTLEQIDPGIHILADIIKSELSH